MDKFWLFAVAVGPVLLGCAIVFAMMRRRRLSEREKNAQIAAIADLYDKPTTRS